jgi:hypothetical protein
MPGGSESSSKSCASPSRLLLRQAPAHTSATSPRSVAALVSAAERRLENIPKRR